MWLQLTLIFFALVVYAFLNNQGDNPRRRHHYVTFLIIILILQSALRHVAVGADTFGYYETFTEIKYKSWASIWQGFHDTYILGTGKDPGYPLLQKLFYYISDDYRVFLFAIAIAFFFPFYRFLEKHIHSLQGLFLSFCIYETIYYGFFSITGLRQTIATIATIYGMYFIIKRKLIPFLIIILCAATIHKSVLVFAPFYFLYNLPKSKTILVVCLLCLPLLIQIARPFALYLAEQSGAEYYLNYANSTWETDGAQNYLLLLIGASLLILLKKYRDAPTLPNFAICGMCLALVFAPLTWVDPTLMRVGQYYSIFMLIAIPQCITTLNLTPNMRGWIFWIFTLILIAVIIKHNSQYEFFWNYMELGENYFRR